MFPIVLSVVAFGPMLAEARIAARHDRILRLNGAVEPAADVYRMMQVLYPAAFLGMILECWLAGSGLGGTQISGGILFAAAKLLKYWSIATLGTRWTFRVLVPPDSVRILTGPYRFLRHPNYVAVVGELTGFALLASAPASGLLSVAVFLLLIMKRVGVEERALGIRAK